MEWLTKDKMLSAFQSLSMKLQLRRTRGVVYVVGGAAVALAYDDTRLTQDVDARIDEGHGAVISAAVEVCRERGWNDAWLNEQPVIFIPKGEDSGAATVFAQPGLVVRAAAPRRLIAMKMLAGRGRDIRDMALLIEKAPELRTAEDLIALVRRMIPSELIGDLGELKETAHLVLEDAGLA